MIGTELTTVLLVGGPVVAAAIVGLAILFGRLAALNNRPCHIVYDDGRRHLRVVRAWDRVGDVADNCWPAEVRRGR